jgi:hypothetical protein
MAQQHQLTIVGPGSHRVEAVWTDAQLDAFDRIRQSASPAAAGAAPDRPRAYQPGHLPGRCDSWDNP